MFGLFFCAVLLLDVGAATGSPASKVFVAGVPWLLWRIAAGVFILLSAALFVAAVDILRTGEEWGLRESLPRRWLYLGLAALTVVAFGVILTLSGGHVRGLPIEGQAFRTGLVVDSGLIASIPWLAIVWLAGTECSHIADELRSLPDEGLRPTATDGPRQSAPHREVIDRLLKLWQLLITCVTAFALAVVAAIVTTGAIRAAFISAYPARAAEFPPANVLFYGGFFALVLTAITLPLASSWRGQAHQVVERTYPLPADGQPAEAWLASRARLEHLLHLDIPVLRNPLTALSIFTPLITAVLAAFIPQLAH